MKNSAQDFWIGVRPIIQKRMNATILPLEQLQETDVVKAFDHSGIDAFYITKHEQLKGLASRMNYGSYAQDKPMFSLRYALWDRRKNEWDFNREYQKKLDACENPEEFTFFPKFHVESFGHTKGEGDIGWSYLAETGDIVRYIKKYINDEKRVRVFTPKRGEKRQVVTVPIEPFSDKHVLYSLNS